MSSPDHPKPFLNTQPVEEDPDSINVLTQCPMCGQGHMVRMPVDAFMKWQVDGEFLRFAWPEGTRERWELLISGIDEACWEKLIEAMDRE